MSKRRSERLKIVLQMEERREEEAREAMQTALQAYEREQARLSDLTQYHTDYENQARQQRQGPQTGQQLIGWQQFISQVNQAIAQQQAQVERLRSRVDQHRELWRAAWEKREAMDRHIRQCRLQEQQDADRREQKVVDEAVNLRYARPDHRRR